MDACYPILTADRPREGEGSPEETLRAEVSAREALLAELYHRVTNHLQLMSSIIGLESRACGGEAQALVASIQQRLSALGMTYSALGGRGGDTVPADEFLMGLCRPLRGGNVHIEVIADSRILLPARTAPALGIIVNEAVCNALKHAFPEARLGIVTVAMRREGDDLCLQVRDNGVGLRPGSRSEPGRGSRFMEQLTRQLQGSVTTEATPEGGTEMHVVFPDLWSAR